jgi:hypothetical protein
MNNNLAQTEQAIEQAGVKLTPAQAKARRQRNIAIGLIVFGFCVLFYAMTLAKLGAFVAHKAH